MYVNYSSNRNHKFPWDVGLYDSLPTPHPSHSRSNKELERSSSAKGGIGIGLNAPWRGNRFYVGLYIIFISCQTHL